MNYYILDLERTLLTNTPCYWKPAKRGYTHKVNEAGIYSKPLAEEIVKHDIENHSIIINIETVRRILNS